MSPILRLPINTTIGPRQGMPLCPTWPKHNVAVRSDAPLGCGRCKSSVLRSDLSRNITYHLNRSENSDPPLQVMPLGQKAWKSAVSVQSYVPLTWRRWYNMPQPVVRVQRPKRRSTVHNTLHHHVPQVYVFYFRHTTHLIGYNTRGRSPLASLDINTTSNYCPVTTARVAQSVERRTPVWRAPGSNPTNTQFFFFEFVCWKYVEYNPKNQPIIYLFIFWVLIYWFILCCHRRSVNFTWRPVENVACQVLDVIGTSLLTDRYTHISICQYNKMPR